MLYSRGGVPECFLNTLVSYKVKGIHVHLGVIWDWEAPPGAGDTRFAYYRGSKARIEVRQGGSQHWRTELYVIPNSAAVRAEVTSAARHHITALATQYPGLDLVESNGELHVTVPDRQRTTHQEHFGEVARRFFALLERPSALPAWEKSDMVAKYWVTTRAAELSRKSPPRTLERRAPP